MHHFKIHQKSDFQNTDDRFLAVNLTSSMSAYSNEESFCGKLTIDYDYQTRRYSPMCDGIFYP